MNSDELRQFLINNGVDPSTDQAPAPVPRPTQVYTEPAGPDAPVPRETPSDVPRYGRTWPPLIPATPEPGQPVGPDPYAGAAPQIMAGGSRFVQGALGEVGPVVGVGRSLLHSAFPDTGMPIASASTPGDWTTPEGAARVSGANQYPTGSGFWPNVAAGAERGAGAGFVGGLAMAPFTRGASIIPATIQGAVTGGAGAAAEQLWPASAPYVEAGTALLTNPLAAGRAVAARAPGVIAGLVGSGATALAHHVTHSIPMSVGAGTVVRWAVDRLAHGISSGATAGGSLLSKAIGTGQGFVAGQIGASGVPQEAIDQNMLRPGWGQNFIP